MSSGNLLYCSDLGLGTSLDISVARNCGGLQPGGLVLGENGDPAEVAYPILGADSLGGSADFAVQKGD
jgi:hypothetical protein